MQAFSDFRGMPASFWAMVKFVSQELGYAKNGVVKTYTEREIADLLVLYGLKTDRQQIKSIIEYTQLRAVTLNDFVRSRLMNVQTAREEFEKLYPIHRNNGFLCSLPMNKQKGEMKQIAYFTAIINILAECTIRGEGLAGDNKCFNDDPRSLTYIIDNGMVVGASSRRMDGAYPDIINPRIIWEIKEYYYTTTFGSRVADGVYETQLDGYELMNISKQTNRYISHVLFIDGYKTWWEDGKSYLCRIVDMLNAGLVDEVIIGREVLDRWPILLQSVLR